MTPPFAWLYRQSTPLHNAASGAGLPGCARIMTLSGEMTVADLRPGMRVIARDSGTAALGDVQERRVLSDIVRIRAGALGHNRPERDITLPAGQPVLLRDWRAQVLYGAPQALVPAARLVDGQFVTLQGPGEMDVYDLIFDSPHVLYVDGMELATTPGQDQPA